MRATTNRAGLYADLPHVVMLAVDAASRLGGYIAETDVDVVIRDEREPRPATSDDEAAA